MDKTQITRDQLTIEDVAHYLRRDAAEVRRWLEDGLLPGYSLPGGHWLIMRDDLDAFLTAHRHQVNEDGRITRLRAGGQPAPGR